MSTEYSVTTIAAREKFAKAHRGDITLPPITQIAFGNGGHDPSTGDPIIPSDTLVAVPGEFLKKAIDSSSYPDLTTLRVVGSLTTAEGVGEYVSACGLYDSEGTLVAVKTFTAKGKDADMVIEIEWDEKF